MSMKQVFLNLSSEEALRVTMILLDEDKDEALKFLKEVLKPKVDQAARGGLNPFPSKLRLS